MKNCGLMKVGGAYIAESAVVVGDVTLGEGVTIWHHCVLRGDVAPIRVGAGVNVQDGTVLHCRSGVPLEIADEVAIGHRAVVHCKRVGSGTLVGIGAVILDDSEIGEGCLIAAGAVVPPGSIVPPNSLVKGVPGRVAREVSDTERAYIRRVLDSYQRLGRAHYEGEFPPLE